MSDLILPAENKVRVPATSSRRHHVHLADHEWTSNTDLRKVAEQHINEHGPKDPYSLLTVTVWEHAGWYETYARVSGRVVCVGTANPHAEYSVQVEAVRMVLAKLPTVVEEQTTFRRGPDSPRVPRS